MALCIYKGGFWFRIFGYGLSVINKHKNPPLASERLGLRKVWRVGRYGVEILKRR